MKHTTKVLSISFVLFRQWEDFCLDMTGLSLEVQTFYELYFGIADIPSMQGWAMSIALLGCLIGAMITGFMADKYGRRPLLLVAAIIFLISAYATGATHTFTLFLFARF